MKLLLWRPLALLFFGLGSQAFCQNAPDSLSRTLQEVVVAANRSADSLKKVPQEIKVISAGTIRMFQPQTTADLLQSSANVFVQKSQQGGGSPVLRGFEANRICLVIDGVRMNNAIYRGGHLQNVLTIDSWSLDRVEVLQGPASVMYGSDALGGVLHFVTRKPELARAGQKQAFSSNMFFRYGSANQEKTAHAGFNVGFRKFAALTSLTFSSFGDLMMGKNKDFFPDSTEFGKRNFYVRRINGKDSSIRNSNPNLQTGSGYSQFDLVQRFRFQPKPNQEHGLNVQISTSTDVPRYDRLTETRKGLPRYAEWYYGPQKRVLLAYDFEQRNDTVRPTRIFHIGANHQWIEESRNTRNFRSDNRSVRLERLQVSGFNLDYKLKDGAHTLRLGGDFQGNDLVSTAQKVSVSGTGNSPESTRYPDGTNQFYNSGIFLSHSWDVHPKITLSEAFRGGFTHLNSTFKDKSFYPFPFSEIKQTNFVYSGSLGLVFRPEPATKLSALVSTGFRSPNIDDLAKIFDSSPGTLIVPNPNLKPEKTITSELNFDARISNAIRWQGAAYYTFLYDAIVTDSFSFAGSGTAEYNGQMSQVFANQNQSEAFITGYSTGFLYQISKAVSAEGSVSYTYGRVVQTGRHIPLDHIPPVVSRLAISYEKASSRLMLYVLYNGHKKIKDYRLNGEDNEAYAPVNGMPSWYTINLRFQHTINSHFDVYGGIENILDMRYRSFSSGINGAGRNLSCTLKARL